MTQVRRFRKSGREPIWPFVGMEVGESARFEKTVAKQALQAMHAIMQSYCMSKHFKYERLPDGAIVITRVATVAESCRRAPIESLTKMDTLPDPSRTPRMKWPFKSMAVGDEVVFDYRWFERAQIAAHAYAYYSGWKFKTRTRRTDGAIVVKRVA